MTVPILVYHGLNTSGNLPVGERNTYGNNDHVALYRDLRIIQKLGFSVIKREQLLRYILGTIPRSALPGRCVVLNFDDGSDLDYRDFNDGVNYITVPSTTDIQKGFPWRNGWVKSMKDVLQDFRRVHGSSQQTPATLFVIALERARRDISGPSTFTSHQRKFEFDNWTGVIDVLTNKTPTSTVWNRAVDPFSGKAAVSTAFEGGLANLADLPDTDFQYATCALSISGTWESNIRLYCRSYIQYSAGVKAWHTGYGAFFGKNAGLGTGYWLAVEKAWNGGSSLHAGVQANFVSGRFYRVCIQVEKSGSSRLIWIQLYAFASSRWQLVAETSYADSTGIITDYQKCWVYFVNNTGGVTIKIDDLQGHSGWQWFHDDWWADISDYDISVQNHSLDHDWGETDPKVGFHVWETGAGGAGIGDFARVDILSECQKEVRDAKDLIEAITEKPVNSFDYPYGKYSQYLMETYLPTIFSPPHNVTSAYIVEYASLKEGYAKSEAEGGSRWRVPRMVKGGAVATSGWASEKELACILENSVFQEYAVTHFDSTVKESEVPGSKVRGFAFGCHDGTYLYPAPCYLTASSFHGRVLRYDARLPFENADSWELYDISNLNTPKAGGFHGAFVAGQHVYYVPLWQVGSSPVTMGCVATRYNRALSFSNSGAWEFFNMATKTLDVNGRAISPKGYVMGDYDGQRYVYYFPWDNIYGAGGHHGILGRYDTLGDFDDPASWDFVDMTKFSGYSNAKGFHGGCYANGYLYLAPHALSYDPFTFSGLAVQYNTNAAIGSQNSYKKFDITTKHLGANSFYGAAFDGRYVWYAPYINLIDNPCVVARYDTTNANDPAGGFASGDNWEVLDMITLYSYMYGGTVAVGYAGCFFDGRWVWFAPFYDDTLATHIGMIARFDTKYNDGIDDVKAWSFLDLRNVNDGLNGFHGVVCHGGYAYLIPDEGNAGYHGNFAKIDCFMKGAQYGSKAGML